MVISMVKIGKTVIDITSFTILVLTLTVAPAVLMALAGCLSNPTTRLECAAANIIPSNSVSIGYVLLAAFLVFITILGSLSHGKMIGKIQKNLSKNMIQYTFLVIVLGILTGHYLNLKSLSSLIIPVVFIMIFPMMVNLSLSSLKKVRRSTKPLIEALILNFIYAPLFMWFLTSIFISDLKIRAALMLLSIAPASSMGLGYIGVAEGNMLTGTMIVASAFLMSILVYPFAGHYFALGANIQVPITMILKNLLMILILPAILGVSIREYVERKYGTKTFLKIKPYFSTVTLTFLYILLFIIFASKANLILKKYFDIVLLSPVAILFYGITTLFVSLVNKKLFSLGYGHHQAVVFTAVSKNVALTIAILVSIFGKEGQYMAVAPAIMSLFQAPFLMSYLKLSGKVKRWFGEMKEENQAS